MVIYFGKGLGAYYVLCGACIYFKVGAWTKRPSHLDIADSEHPQDGGNDAAAPSSPPSKSNRPGLARARQMSIFKRLGPARGADTNPFYSDAWRLAEADRLKMATLGPVLVPLRVAAALLALLPACLLSSIAVAGLPLESFQCGSTRPLARWRRLFRPPVRFLGRCLLFALGYVYLEEEGAPAPPDVAPVVVANHVGPVEPFILGVRTGGMPVSKLENASLPLFGALCRAFLPIFVDRNDPASRTAVRDEIEARARGAAAGEYGGPVFLFPEGTCTNGMSVITFKAGAFQPRLPVQPVVFSFPHRPGQIYPSWTVVGPSLPELFLRLLCEPYNRCKITWLPPTAPLGPKETSVWPGPKVYAARVQNDVAAALGSETSRFAFEDVLLMREARKLGDRYSPLATGGAAVEFKRLQDELLDVSLEDAKRYLATFHRLDREVDGQLTFDEFRAVYADRDIPADYLQNMFDLLDDDCSGRLDFKEFLVGASLVNSSSEKTLDAALKFSFQIFDLKREGMINLEGAQRILRVVHPDASESGLKQIFDKIDANGDGYVDQAEFVTFVKEHEEALPRLKQLLIV